MDRQSLLREFGRRIKMKRAECGISQESLAIRAGLDRTYISGLERGLRNPSLTCIFKVAKGLEVPCEDLLTGIV